MTDARAGRTIAPDGESDRARVTARATARAVSTARSAAVHRFALASVAAVAVLVSVWAIFVGTEPGQRMENLSVRGAELRSATVREASLERLSQISVAAFALAVVCVFVVGLLRRRGGLGSAVAAVMVLSVVAAEALKALLPRPELVSGPVWILRNSFPSGTAAVASAIAVGAFLIAPDRLRWVLLPVGAVYAAVVGEAIQTTGWHRLSDTIGSTALVIAVAAGGLAVLARAGLVQPSDRGLVDRRVRNAMIVLACVALLLGTVLIAVVLLFPLLTTPEGSRRAFLQTAFPLLGAGFTVLALLLFARTVEPFSLGRGPVEPEAPAERG